MTLIASLLMLARKGYGVKQGRFTPALRTTIGDIPQIAKADPRYVDIAFLGAHDANTGMYADTKDLEPAASKAVIKFEPIIFRYMCRFVKTQTLPIYDLLTYGCRFLHIKVTEYQNGWQTSHTVLTGELKPQIEDVLRFMTEREGEGEIVSILFQPIYFGEKSFADFHDFLAGIRYKGKNIFDFVHYAPVDEFHNGEGVRVGDLHYGDVTKNGKSGIVLFQRRDQHHRPSWDARKTDYPYFFDMDSNALHVWHDHSSVRLLDRAIDKTVEELSATDAYNDLLRMNQTQPSSSSKCFGDVISSLYSRSLLRKGMYHNVKLLERPDFEQMLKLMPVFQVDYLTSDYGDFNRRVNLAIREYNEKMVKNLLDK